ncbi:MAG: outer membrane protein assembly factor BamD [Candidatus Omnitrophica bacterium]|nr:outer membrane protein assembly factor BamD [Candidatus Omnitrophota bacterium]
MQRIQKIAVILFLVTALRGFAYWEWTPKTGRWVNPKYAVQETAKEQFELAEKYRKDGAVKKAIAEHEKLLKHYAGAEYAAQSCFALGEIYQSLGDVKEAFNYYQKIVDGYPSSPLVMEAVKRQSAIAEETLQKSSIKYLGRQEERGKMMETVVESHPYGEDTPEKAILLGQFYVEIEEFGKAKEVFEGIATRYTNPAVIEEAKYNLIRAEFLETPDVSKDTVQYAEVGKKIDSFLKLYPESVYRQDVISIRDSLSEREAKKYFEIAVFYERAGKKDAAKYYYKILAQDYPETEYGKTAAKKIGASD